MKRAHAPAPEPAGRRVLVAGWFSFLHGEATAGDLQALAVICRWLDQAGVAYDVALSPVLNAAAHQAGVAWSEVDPGDYTDVVFACGPAYGIQVDKLVTRFSGCRLLGVNVSMIDPVGVSQPFDVLWERDSDRAVRPDIAVAGHSVPVPVVGIVAAHDQPEYGGRAGHAEAHAAIDRLVDARSMVPVRFDTHVHPAIPGRRSSDEVEALVARMDVVVTTRLHGLVFALKYGVPALAVDPVRGGAKVAAQARALGWEAVLTVDELTDEALRRAFDRCLEPNAGQEAAAAAQRARAAVERLGAEFRAVVGDRSLPAAVDR